MAWECFKRAEGSCCPKEVLLLRGQGTFPQNILKFNTFEIIFLAIMERLLLILLKEIIILGVIRMLLEAHLLQ